jgi:protein-disulfide isomerase
MTCKSGLCKALLAFFVFALPASATFGQECATLSPMTERAIASYVQKRYRLTASVALGVAEVSAVPGTCYRKITLKSESDPRAVVVYLTPDQKYIVPALMDLSEDPLAAVSAVEHQVNDLLLNGNPPARGTRDAQVTIVEFADFQCPFCRNFAEMLQQLDQQDMARVRVVFRQMPLQQHPWAQQAAIISTCVDFQSPEAFWKLHDFIYTNQPVLNSQNLQSTLFQFARDKLHIDSGVINSCIEHRMYEGALNADQELSKQLNVRATPTIFVNGRKYIGMRSVDQLKAAIDHASGNQTTRDDAGANQHQPD